jgi:putative peptidoglycan lipid II flippase
VTVSIATPYFTRMSGHARDGSLDAVRGDLSSSLRTILLLVTGAGVALAAAALPFAAFFARDDREVASFGAVLLAYLIGLVPLSTLFLVQRTFYALGDTRTPFFFQLFQSVLFVIGAIAVIGVPANAIAASIALVTSFAGIAQTVVAILLLRRRLHGIDGRHVLRRVGVYAVATIPAVLVGLLLLAALGGLAPAGIGSSGFALAGRLQAFVAVVVVGGVTGIVYLTVLWLARVPELRELVSPLRRLMRRP